MRNRRAFLKEAGAITVLVSFVRQPLRSFAVASPDGEEPAVAKSREPLGFKPHWIKQGDGRGGWIVRPAQYQFLQTSTFKPNQSISGFGLAQMDKGEVVLLFSWHDGGEGRGGMAERPLVAFSHDGGSSWTDPKLIEGLYGRPMMLAYLGKGTLTFTCGWQEAGKPVAVRCMSNDYGRTWTERFPPQPTSDGEPFGVEGNPLVDRDVHGVATRMAEIGYQYDKGLKWPKDPATGIIRWSSDGGRTWTDELKPKVWRWQEEYNGKTYTRGISEGSLVRAANGWLVAALRTDMPARYFDVPHDDSLEGTGVSISKDDGKTWSPIKILYDAGRHHAHLLRLPNGDIVMTITVRDDVQDGRLASYRRGCEAIISHDHGLTWDLSRKYILDEFQFCDNAKWFNGECGHLYSVLLDDGYILTTQKDYLTRRASLIKWKPSARQRGRS